MAYQVIGEGAMLLHFAFLVYVTFGGFLAWRWPRTLWAHVPIAAYALGIAVIGWVCPLTHVENWGRRNAGQEGITGTGFIDNYLSGIIYPEGQMIVFELMVGTSVAISWIGVVLIHLYRRHRAPPAPHPTDGH
ncbi:DUF2784 domain-containing protein [Nocardiopsis salina]|uniref:DUF2784 domain-containing protein n=1 Tax=Nocardiopsis salina TaxID=245836 RepID=UPI000475534C|nr:DUF2784 domain-containing protein [Nocardiopsis salina]